MADDLQLNQMDEEQPQDRLREVEAQLRLNYIAFSEQYYELRRRERIFRGLFNNENETARELYQLRKITEDYQVLKIQTFNILRNNMKRTTIAIIMAILIANIMT
jgi:hypothetical protein